MLPVLQIWYYYSMRLRSLDDLSSLSIILREPKRMQ
jgi:hypothetical protein